METHNNEITIAGESITDASRFGHIEMVKLLLKDPCVDPSYLNNLPIKMASIYRRTEIVKLLLTDERVRNLAISQGDHKDYLDIIGK